MMQRVSRFGKKVSHLLLLSLLFLSPFTIYAEEDIKIGAHFELSGDMASYGQAMLEGVQLAAEQKNADGGVLDGRKIKVVSYDNTSETSEATAIATRLVSEGVVGIIGPATSGHANAQTPIIQEAKIPVVLPAATGDDVTLDANGDVFDYLFRVCFADSFQGGIGATFAAENLEAKRAVIINDSASDYSQGLTDEFVKVFEAEGGEIVTTESFTAGDTDFSAILTSIMGHDFDVIYIPAYYTEAGMIIKSAREFGIEQPIIGSDGFSSDVLIELAGSENASDVYYTDHFSALSSDETVQNYIQSFEEKFDRTSNTFNALAYDAAMLLFDAIERAGNDDPEAIAQALAETSDFKGVSGEFSIDEFHNPVKSAVVIELQDGEIVKAESISLN